MKSRLILTLIMVSVHVQAMVQFVYHPFDEAMRLQEFPQAVAITKRVTGIAGNDFLALCRRLYNQYNPAVLAIDEKPRIPKIIHQVWLGSPVPVAFEKYMKSWVEHHMHGWEYKLWTDENLKEFGLYNQAFYDQVENYGVKSDIVKWEVVYRFGGVYADTDEECLQALDIFHHTLDFYTALQPLDTQFVQLGAALFGAVPGHPILKHCIETIKDDWHLKGAPMKTGPVHFTKSFYAVAGTTGMRDLALPAFYIYPLGCRETQLNRELWIQQGAFAVHHWAKSWMPQKYRTKEFRSIPTDASVNSWND